MNIIHPSYTRLDSRYLVRMLLTLTVMVLLVAVWIALFLWGLLITENILAHLGVISLSFFGSGEVRLGSFFEGGFGSYAPAFLLLFLSQLLFFYRMPRTQRRVAVPLEFMITTFLFITLHLLLLFTLNFLAPDEDGLSHTINLGLTLTMLGLFFWLQWSGLVGRYVRKYMKKPLDFIALDIFAR